MQTNKLYQVAVKNYKKLLDIAHSFVGNKADAEEYHQQFFLHLIEGRISFSDEPNLWKAVKTRYYYFLRSSLYNKATQERANIRQVIVADSEKAHRMIHSVPSHYKDIEYVDENSSIKVVNAELIKLEKEAPAAVMAFITAVNNDGPADAARILDKNINTTKHHYLLILRKLKQKFQENALQCETNHIN